MNSNELYSPATYDTLLLSTSLSSRQPVDEVHQVKERHMRSADTKVKRKRTPTKIPFGDASVIVEDNEIVARPETRAVSKRNSPSDAESFKTCFLQVPSKQHYN